MKGERVLVPIRSSLPLPGGRESPTSIVSSLDVTDMIQTSSRAAGFYEGRAWGKCAVYPARTSYQLWLEIAFDVYSSAAIVGPRGRQPQKRRYIRWERVDRWGRVTLNIYPDQLKWAELCFAENASPLLMRGKTSAGGFQVNALQFPDCWTSWNLLSFTSITRRFHLK